MDDKLRHEIWQRDQSTCQKCKRKLFDIEDLKETTSNALRSIDEIPVYKWSRECWKCGKETPAVSYYLELNFFYSIGEIEKLDRFLRENYSFVKEKYSKTMGRRVIANVCVHCGSLQGNWFISREIFEMCVDDIDFVKLIDQTIPNTLIVQDLPNGHDLGLIKRRLTELGEVHHKDGNPENDNPDNLILLCVKCHGKIPKRKSTLQSREEARRVRENRKIEREKAEADKCEKITTLKERNRYVLLGNHHQSLD